MAEKEALQEILQRLAQRISELEPHLLSKPAKQITECILFLVSHSHDHLAPEAALC